MGNTTEVNTRRGGPLVPQKLLYVGHVCLMRLDQTNGKIVVYDMKSEGGYPRLGQILLACGQLIAIAWSKALVLGLMQTNPILPVTFLDSANIACRLR